MCVLLWVAASISSSVQAGHQPAYLDPGSGSYLFQILIASLVGAGFAVKMCWGYIKSFVVLLFTKKRDNDAQS